MKTWFITGISRGLGKALAQAALSRGDTVVGTVREGAPELATGQGKLHVLTVDLTDAAAITPAVRAAFERAGRIDVLVNNAGYGLLGALEHATDAEFERLFAVNVFAPFAVIRAALPQLRRQGSGHILNITSIAGRAPAGSSGLYSATKAALEGLTQSLAQEIAPFGLKVTAIAPGAFRTDFLSDHSIQRSRGGEDYAQSVGTAVARLDAMAGRQIGDPDQAAAAILALVDVENPPLHLLLGSDALRRAREKLDAVIDEIDRWETITRSTDHREAPSAVRTG
ncbi:3-phenylpropionate-dihydrodiol/cinnamic acid-dihydrodiol dehydrogenase [Sphingomonas sp. S2M10]|uniref:oxidoreductase n=1 Tax=Sphingomonas sp. S2M10 TaxID=2705010 RepID=UPI001457166E|nr:oxidoreductase [Sphingomonas sp. S2M10]NLS27457.1 3-phenylpropionate-dihydrodiol/cinnamic acid-dihydrodiol dehydrogenase [Sphingomonas sp. S2M10]